MRSQTDGVELNYDIKGDGPWLVMSHSLACDLHMWDEEAERLSQNYKVLRFDTRGHGKSDAPQGPYSIEMLADDLLRLLTKLDVHEIHFVGLSMGGMIGQALALSNPELVKSLVLCDTSSELNFNVNERASILERHGMDGMLEATLQRFFFRSLQDKDSPAVKKVSNMMRNTSVAGYVGCCHAISSMNFTARLGEIRCPTLIMVGDHDVATPLSMSEELHRRISDSRLFIVPNAGHLANLEQPDIFNNELTSFLQEVSS